MNQMLAIERFKSTDERPSFRTDDNSVHVMVQWLRRNAARNELRVVDVCVRHSAVQLGYIPGAISLEAEPSVIAEPGNLAETLEFALIMSRNGIGDEHIIVLYDEGDEQRASKLYRKLIRYGHERTFMLLGGRAAWVNAGGELAKVPSKSSPMSFTVRNIHDVGNASHQTFPVSNVRKARRRARPQAV